MLVTLALLELGRTDKVDFLETLRIPRSIEYNREKTSMDHCDREFDP